MKIYVSNTPGAPDAPGVDDFLCRDALTLDLENTPSCLAGDNCKPIAGLRTYECTAGVQTGKYVKIFRNDTVSLCEVKVFSAITAFSFGCVIVNGPVNELNDDALGNSTAGGIWFGVQTGILILL
jgi:hypothetical protein